MSGQFLRQKIMLRAFACCLLAIGCAAQGINPTTVPVSESQVLPSKDPTKHDAWSWSQPEISSSSSASASSESQLSPSFRLPELNLNGHGSDLQRTEYPPYPFEAAISEDSHHAASVKDAENSLGTITKHFAVVSFIGLLLLFAIIQNTIVAAKRRDSFLDNSETRRRRDTVVSLRGLDLMTPEEAAVLNDDAQVRCMQRALCLQNRKLGKNLGKTGKLVAKFLTESVKNSLKDHHPGWDHVVEDAGQAGLRGEDCDILYRDCDSSKI